MRNRKNIYFAIIVGFVLFLSYFWIVKQINFTQNDDFYYYDTVSAFMRRDFRLPQKMAPTFYLQGVIGTLFSFLFGVNKLPLLTLFVSVLNIVILIVILIKFFDADKITAILLSFLLFFNPLYQYSILGFMTENYLILFILISLYFWLNYKLDSGWHNLVLSNLAILLGFFVRQVILIVPLAYALKFLFEKKQKEFSAQLLFFLSVTGFYFFIFPHTDEMYKKSLQIGHLFKQGYAFAVIYGTLLYLAAFFLPSFVLPVLDFIKKSSLKSKIIWLLITSVLLFSLNRFYRPMVVSWGEFPFFENVFERTGFLPRSVHGTKYYFRGSYDLYHWWEISAKIVLASFISMLLINIKKRSFFKNTNFLIIFLYICLMTVAYTFYDRYTVFILVPFSLLMGGEFSVRDSAVGKMGKILISLFLIFLIYFGYFLSVDFVKINSTIWTSAKKLEASGIPSNEIYATSSWNKKYGSAFETSKFIYSYDSQKINQDFRTNFKLVDQFDLSFPYDNFINPKLYLYEKQ